MTEEEKRVARRTGIEIERDRLAIADMESRKLYHRVTPEIMAELAFQQINLIASRLTLTGQRDFYAKIQKYISEIQ